MVTEYLWLVSVSRVGYYDTIDVFRVFWYAKGCLAFRDDVGVGGAVVVIYCYYAVGIAVGWRLGTNSQA